jgi:hypothetical protein
MRSYKSRSREVLFLGGWLFTDLLLLLTFLFFIGNVDMKPKPIPPTPTVPHLELMYRRIPLSIDPDGLLRDMPSARESVRQQVKQWQHGFLATRRVGLVITYAGAPDDTQIGLAFAVDQKIDHMLGELGRQGFAFNNTSYYDPLYRLGDNRTVAIIDVYLFAK